MFNKNAIYKIFADLITENKDKKCNETEKYWEEEFEDYIFRGYCENAENYFIGCVDYNITETLDKYIYGKRGIPFCDKVKIKARKGTILIERV